MRKKNQSKITEFEAERREIEVVVGKEDAPR
jgi:hypothetical protein